MKLQVEFEMALETIKKAEAKVIELNALIDLLAQNNKILVGEKASLVEREKQLRYKELRFAKMLSDRD